MSLSFWDLPIPCLMMMANTLNQVDGIWLWEWEKSWKGLLWALTGVLRTWADVVRRGQVNCTLWSGADGSWCYWLWRLGTCHGGNNNRQKWGQGTFHNEWLHGLAIILVAVWGLNYKSMASQDLAGSILEVTLTATTYSMSTEHSTKNRYHLLVGTYFWNKEPGEKPLHQVWISAWLPCVTTAQESGTHPSIILIHRWVVI